jgi:hypothetical protein
MRTALRRSCKVALEVGGIQVSALFDTGSEINLMPCKTYARMSLPLVDRNLYLSDANNNSTCLMGYSEGVRMACGPVVVSQHVYVQQEASYEFLVGMPFLRSTRAETWFDKAGSLWVRLHGSDGISVSVCMTHPDDPRNITKLVTTTPPHHHHDDEEYGTMRATLVRDDDVPDGIDDELEWPVNWDGPRRMDWAVEVEHDLRQRKEGRERPVILDGQRVQLMPISEEERREEGRDEDVRDVFVAELEAGTNWDLVMPVKELRGWVADLKKEDQ